MCGWVSSIHFQGLWPSNKLSTQSSSVIRTRKLNSLMMLSLGTLMMKVGLVVVRLQCGLLEAAEPGLGWAGQSRLLELGSLLGPGLREAACPAPASSPRPAEDLEAGVKSSATST